jgi:hypothetical protein
LTPARFDELALEIDKALSAIVVDRIRDVFSKQLAEPLQGAVQRKESRFAAMDESAVAHRNVGDGPIFGTATREAGEND